MADDQIQACESNNSNPPTGADSVGQRLLEDSNNSTPPSPEQIQSVRPADIQTQQRSITDLGFPNCTVEDKSKQSSKNEPEEKNSDAKNKKSEASDNAKYSGASDNAKVNGATDNASKQKHNAADEAKVLEEKELEESKPSEDPAEETEPKTDSGENRSPYVAKKELDPKKIIGDNQDEANRSQAANGHRLPPPTPLPVPDAKGRIIEKPLPSSTQPVPDPSRFHRRHF